MSGRQAAFVGSTTAHGGNVVAGCGQVLINNKPAARRGDAVDCKAHGPGEIDGGNPSVLVGGKPLARILDPVKCVPSAPGLEPLVDHGKPTKVVGSLEIHVDGDLASVPEAEMNELVEALMGDDEDRKIRAMKNLPLSGNLLKGKLKVVDRGNPGYPNVWTEVDVTGPGGELRANRWIPLAPEVSYENGDLKVEGGATAQLAGVKVTRKSLDRNDDGDIVESHNAVSYSLGGGAVVKIKAGKSGLKVEVDTPHGGASEGRVVVASGGGGATPPSPAANAVVAPTSADVLVG